MDASCAMILWFITLYYYLLGDVNSDGYDDFAIGIVSLNQVYLIFGAYTPFNKFALPYDGSVSKIAIISFTENIAGIQFSSLGDVNKDGINDFVISNPNFYRFRGLVNVLYGKQVFPSKWSIADMTAKDGFAIYGSKDNEYFGSYVSSMRYYNAASSQWCHDIMIGGTNNAFIFPCVDTWQSAGFRNLNIHDLPSNVGMVLRSFKLLGNSFQNIVASTVGDLDGDGLHDFGVGSSSVSSVQGGVFVIFGKYISDRNIAKGIDMDSMTAADGVRLIYSAARIGLGSSFDFCGDINGKSIHIPMKFDV